MKNSVLLLLLFFSMTKAYTQAQDQGERSLQLSGISAQNGTFNFHDNYGGSLETFKKLAPESDLLDKNFDDFNQSFYQSDPDYSGAFSVQFTFNWLNMNESWKKLNPQLKFGFSYGNINLIRGNLNKVEYHRIDTLISTSSGQEYYVDSVESEDYTLNYDADFLVLDASLIIGSNPMNRWSFYGGFGLSAGMNFNTTARIFSTKDQYIDSRGNYNNPRNHWDPEFREEVFRKNETGLALMLTMPLGVNFRLSKDKKIWENLSLFLEAKPALSYFSVSGIDNSFYASTFNSFGLKYSFWE
ncbi:MAG: hypothetical protein WD530_04895 [Vicingaceae bacterium]